MTDVPFGVLLSGGLDSSLVASVAIRHLEKSDARQWGSKLHTFCIGLKVLPNLLKMFSSNLLLFTILLSFLRDLLILKLVKKLLTT